eukprot:884366-Amphidinium_carterae.1
MRSNSSRPRSLWEGCLLNTESWVFAIIVLSPAEALICSPPSTCPALAEFASRHEWLLKAQHTHPPRHVMMNRKTNACSQLQLYFPWHTVRAEIIT